MMRIEVNQTMMKQIDTLVSSAAILGLFVLISLIFLLDLHGQIIIYTLLPVVSGIVGWKGAYFIYRSRHGNSHVHEVGYACMECA